MIYAVGDIHGHAAALDSALALIEADGGAEAPVVFLGDYVDRGPDSRGVLDRLIDGIVAGRNWTCLLGNHDRMFLGFVSEGEIEDDRISSGRSWLDRPLGGAATLASYGVDGGAHRPLETIAEEARAAVPEAHLDFVASLPLWHAAPELVFVHAGIRPGVPMEEQVEDDLIWIRAGFLNDTRDHGPLIVHGHTALEHPTAFPNRVDLDGGAGYGNPLWPAVFEGRDCWLLKAGGREKLVPVG